MTDLHTTTPLATVRPPRPWQRLLALAGIAFAVLMFLAWFLNSAETPEYGAPDHDWTNWAKDSEMKQRFAAFFALLAGLVFLPFATTIRDVLANAEERFDGSVRLARVAFAGGLIGITGITMATVMITGASAQGADADPVVSKAIATATVGPFLVAPMGFVGLLASAGLITLRTGALPRWTGIVALIGAVSFAITFLVTIDGATDGSVFGYGFFPGFLALVTWSIGTSLATHRTLMRPVIGASAAGEERRQ